MSQAVIFGSGHPIRHKAAQSYRMPDSCRRRRRVATDEIRGQQRAQTSEAVAVERVLDSVGESAASFLSRQEVPANAPNGWNSCSGGLGVKVFGRTLGIQHITPCPAGSPRPLRTVSMLHHIMESVDSPFLNSSGFSDITQCPLSTSTTSNLGKKRPIVGSISSAT